MILFFCLSLENYDIVAIYATPCDLFRYFGSAYDTERVESIKAYLTSRVCYVMAVDILINFHAFRRGKEIDSYFTPP